MNLYFIHAETDDGENLDLMVRCDTVEEAALLWDEYHGVTPDAAARFWLVNPTTIGALGWHDPDGMLEVKLPLAHGGPHE